MNRLLGPLSSQGSVALLINEFGEIPVDTALVDRGEYAMREITGGCVCCSLKGKLIDAIAEIRDDLRPDYLLVEATGLAEPREIVEAVAALEGCIATGLLCVDPVQYLKFSGALSIFDRQIAGAEVILLTKGDLRSIDETHAARRRIEAAVPSAFLCDEPLEALSMLEFRGDGGDFFSPRPSIDDNIIQRTLRFSRDFSRIELERRCIQLSLAYGDDLLRLKGLVLINGFRTAVHFCEGRLQTELIRSSWEESDVGSFIVVISREDASKAHPPEEFFL